MSNMTGSTVLNSNDLDGVVEYLKSPQCKRVIVMAGAGISTSAGIPDFRSPETGLYANLAKLKLPYPEAVFEINFFRRNPRPFYTLAHELAPGRFRPTITHSFIKLLADKELLLACFTQNIDTLERRAGVPRVRIVEAHGSFATQRCIDCQMPFPHDEMAKHIAEQAIPRCQDTDCGGLVKPDIVFFGESLPPDFTNRVRLTKEADLLIIMGTSLKVYPFAGLANMVDCPRVLINLDPAGDLGEKPDDVVVLAKTDDAVRRIADGMGWLGDLEKEWAKTELKTPGAKSETDKEKRSKNYFEQLKKEVDTITQNVEQVLEKEDSTDAAKSDAVDDVATQLAKLDVAKGEAVLAIPAPTDTKPATATTSSETKL
ncbi:NAD-dependent deacetylase sirtuin-2 [Auriculariales sp. MPI-PUGE-AT-0066]|nr:NAD-dependent deacetylase sirtuin-2 [Auriculariales sp. MPI-PUGE-AT-0066]